MERQIQEITPEIAEELLKKNVHNRTLSEDIVNQIMNDMLNYRFNPNNTNVVLLHDGSIFYGQHVLTAIVRTKRTYELNVYTLEEGEEKKHKRGSLNKNSKYQYHKLKKRNIK